jgi:hypothetical protein
MARASDNIFPKVQFSEEAAPATPSADQGVLYEKADGRIYFKNDAGTEHDLTGGGGATPTFSGVKLSHSANQNRANSSAILFNTEIFDTDAFHNTVSNTSRITIPTTGYYEVGAAVRFDGSGDSDHRGIRIVEDDGTIHVNAGQVHNADLVAEAVTCSTVAFLEVGAWIEVLVIEDSSGDVVVQGNTVSPRFWAYLVGTA